MKVLLLFVSLLVFNALQAQFPASNFKFNTTSKIDTGTPTPPNSYPVLLYDLSKPTDTILQKIDAFRLQFSSLANPDLNAFKSRHPYYAHNIAVLIEKGADTVSARMEDIINQIPGSPAEAAKHDTILNRLENLKSFLNDIKTEYRAINRIMGRPQFENRWAPARNAQEAKLLYGSNEESNITFANNFTLLGTDDKAAVNPELVSGYMGPFKVSINTLISTTKDTSVVEQSKLRLISGGGNTAVTFYYPLFNFRSSSFQFFLQMAPKFVADFPILGASSINRDDFIGSISIAPETFIRISTKENNISFFANFRTGYYTGTKTFKSNLNVPGNFWFGQANLGMFLGSNVQVSATLPVFSSESDLMKTPVLLTTQFFPKISKK